MNPRTDNGHQGHSHKGQMAASSEHFFAQKAEKLATAVYMITDFIDVREPIRWKIREETMAILSDIGAISMSDISSRWGVLYRAIQAIERIEHILSVARATKVVSDMNAAVVLKEYVDLKERLRSSWSTFPENAPRLNQYFFKVDALPDLNDQNKELKRPSQGSSGDRSVAGNQGNQKDMARSTAPNMGVRYGGIPSLEKDKNFAAPRSASDTSVEVKAAPGRDRRGVILRLLGTRPEISVSDVMKELPEVSDKTIQRELVAMVESGILSKKGEKRWSTYSLVRKTEGNAPVSSIGQ